MNPAAFDFVSRYLSYLFRTDDAASCILDGASVIDGVCCVTTLAGSDRNSSYILKYRPISSEDVEDEALPTARIDFISLIYLKSTYSRRMREC